MFCAITSKDILLRISLGSIKRYQKAESHVNVEKIAHRFNQVCLFFLLFSMSMQ